MSSTKTTDGSQPSALKKTFDDTDIQVLLRKSYNVPKSFFQTFEDDIAIEGGEVNERINALISERTDKIQNEYLKTTKMQQNMVQRHIKNHSDDNLSKGQPSYAKQ